jgi:hypothetical protein
LADSDIEINLELIDNASSQLEEASSNSSSSLDMVSDSSSQLASATESTVPPLSESEQAQMQLASAAVKLKDAQATFASATQNLNADIRGNGSDGEEAAVAHSEEEACKLIETGFKYDCEFSQNKILGK